ncbi:MAG: hypothetical protein A2309_03790 [Bacteroidetes bacterium RIFOXYB2_FULL_35_7]|nr:MAG: hypothetical protein A2X01_05435 [Bacteroidetes bacterium GWF2_35_48]OFY93758.1 MAG: hypothetical protein A2309_03790 [Bacteroidetes bacterium RIFOXYB2_FULL_35_7]HBX52197.1 hypothetical protein [Bacteroidales bacterium]
MKRVHKYLFLLVFIQGISVLCFSQSLSDTIKIKEVTITEKYSPDYTGIKVTEIDSAIIQNYQAASLARVLEAGSPAFIKSYGPGRIATSSFRGAASSHTQVLWNGININSTMLGQADLNSLPVFLFDNIILYQGGAALSNNSGAFGGSIHIVNKPDWNRKYSVNITQTAGSFDSYGTYISAGLGIGIIQSNTRFFYNYSANNYPYKLYDGSEDLRNTNSSFSNGGIMQELYVKLKKNQSASFAVWSQKNECFLPGSNGNEKQKTEFIKSSAEWNSVQEKYTLTTRFAFLWNSMDYVNNTAFIHSENRENIFNLHTEGKYNLSNTFIVLSSLDASHNLVNTNNYLYSKTRNTIAIMAGAKTILMKEKLTILTLLKQEITDMKYFPFVPSLGMEYILQKKYDLKLKGSFCRNYKLPGMNDLYWNPGGNTELKPESGYFSEVGSEATIKLNNDNQKLNAQFAFFYSETKDNIVWIPQEGSSFWTAQNLKDVTSKGIEMSVKYSGEIKKMKWALSSNYTYTNAVNKVDAQLKQLIYVPYHTLNSFLHAQWKNIFLHYSYNYTGKRFIYTDNSWYLPPYMLSDAGAGVSFKTSKAQYTIQALIANIFDTDYQVVMGYPMMRRNYRVSVKIGFMRSRE